MRIHSAPSSTFLQRRSRGTAYLLALGLALLITAVATGTLLATRARLAGQMDAVALSKVDALVESATAFALATLNTDATYAGGSVPAARLFNLTLPTGAIRLRLASASAADASSLTPAAITFAATSGKAVRRYQVQAIPARTPPSAFEYSMTVRGTLGVSSGARVDLVRGAGLFGNVVLTGSGAVLGSYALTATNVATGLDVVTRSLRRPVMPSDAQIDALRGEGTALVVPSAGASIVLSNILLSPCTNPYGALNQKGIYVLDCANKAILLSDSRIVGTLILLNPGPGSMLSGGMLMEPAVKGYPSLVVVGNMLLWGSATRLAESTVNFNPQGTPSPYYGGSVDTDLVDNRAAGYEGPVIVTGNLSIAGTVSVQGLLVRGDCAIGGVLSATRDDYAAWSPAPAFVASRWRLVPSTLVEVTSGP